MRLIQIVVFVSFSIPAFPGFGVEAEEVVPDRLKATRESGIQSFFENTAIPLREMESSDIGIFFENLENYSGFKFFLGDAVEGDLRYDVKKQQTYLEFFEETLADNGYTWRRQPGTHLIWISTNSLTQRFTLSPQQRQHLKALTRTTRRNKESSVLRSRILGTASGSNNASAKSSYQIEGAELVVTDTRSNMRKVKKYLDRHNPRQRDRVDSTRRVLGSALYGNKSIEEAAAQGRVMFPNREDGSISIVDTPRNLRKVEEYLRGPRSSSSGLRRVYEPRHRTPADLSNAVRGIVLYTIP